MSSKICRKFLVITSLIFFICCTISQGATQTEILFGRRIQAYLAGLPSTMVGPALKDIIEGRANDGAPIPGNDPNTQIAQQKIYISNHARTHRHFGNQLTLLGAGEVFTTSPPYPSILVINGVSVDMPNANRICNEIMDLLFSGKVSFEVGRMQALHPPALFNPTGNNIRSKRFLLFANLAGHNIKGLNNMPCLFNINPTSPLAPGMGQSSYIQLIVSTQTQFEGMIYPAPQSITITLFPAPNRGAGTPNALPPVQTSPIIRLKHFISNHRKKVYVFGIALFLFILYEMLIENDPYPDL